MAMAFMDNRRGATSEPEGMARRASSATLAPFRRQQSTSSDTRTATKEDGVQQHAARKPSAAYPPNTEPPSTLHPSPAPSAPFPPLRRPTTTASSRPFSAFSRSTKYLIVGIGGVAGLFSPISSNIFVPAIPTLARAFQRTEEEINLAVTVYLVFQAITPSFFGALSDSIGRRPVYILILTIYVAANIGLALLPTTESGYAGLMVLRCLQSTGGSAVIAVGAGAITDVAEPRERGLYMALFQLGAMCGPAIGPFLGGVFTETLGWRAIFWFLAIASGVILVAVIFVLPETLRALVGDGSIPPPLLCASPQMCLQRRKMEHELKSKGEEGEPVVRPPKKKFSVLAAFTILITTPEMTCALVFTSLLYLVFYSVLSLYSTALTNSYHFNELIIGLCYLPSGLGTIIASLLNGRQLDWYYRREEKRAGGGYQKKGEEFRLEAARLRTIYPFAAMSFVSSIALGWCLQARAPLAATLVVNFFMGLSVGTTNVTTVYGQDLRPGQGGAVSASNNLIRCLFGAIGTAVIQILYRAIGAGWTMVLIAGIAAAGFPLLLVSMKYGPRWRAKRLERAKRGKEGVDGGRVRLGEAEGQSKETGASGSAGAPEPEATATDGDAGDAVSPGAREGGGPEVD